MGFLHPGDGCLRGLTFCLRNINFLTFFRYEAVPAGSGVPALKDVAVVKTRLQRVSPRGRLRAGPGSIRRHGQRSEQPAPTSPPHPQVAEELSQCSHNIFDFQGALDGILSDLVKHRQQVHEDKRSVVPALLKSPPTLCRAQLDRADVAVCSPAAVHSPSLQTAFHSPVHAHALSRGVPMYRHG